MYTTYVALLHKAKPSSDYGVFFPDFPGCVFSGRTMDEALENGRTGLIFHIEGLQEDHEILPQATPIEKIMKDPEYEDTVPAVVKIIIPTGHMRRLNISMDENLLIEIDQAAKLAGRNRSEFLADAARNMLA